MIEHIFIDPVDGEFDVVETERFVRSLQYVARDPQWPTVYLASTDPEMLQRDIADRTAEPNKVPYTAIQLGLGPRRMWILCAVPENSPARAFAKWLREKYAVRFLDESFNDVTAEVDDTLDFLFGSP